MAHRCRCPCSELRCVDPGNFPAVSDQEQVALVAEVGLVAATLDGELSPHKTNSIAKAVRSLPGLRELSEPELDLLIVRTGASTERGAAWLCEVTHQIRSGALKRVAFRMASLFCAWDGYLDEREQEYLAALACGFGFSDGEAAGLFTDATGWPVVV